MLIAVRGRIDAAMARRDEADAAAVGRSTILPMSCEDMEVGSGSKSRETGYDSCNPFRVQSKRFIHVVMQTTRQAINS